MVARENPVARSRVPIGEVDDHLPDAEGRSGPVPAANRRGHHPEHEQDQPPLDEMARRLGLAGDVHDAAGERADRPPSGARRRSSGPEAGSNAVTWTTRPLACVRLGAGMAAAGVETGRRVVSSALRAAASRIDPDAP